MPEPIEIFNRFETKYIFGEKERRPLQKLLGEHMVPDVYNIGGKPYVISNIYYDTPTDRIIRESVSKPSYKEKLRLRAYGIPEAGADVFLEIKKKFDGIVGKRRSVLTLEEAYKFAETAEIPEIKPYMNEQVLREIQYMLTTLKPEPKVYIAYDRLAYFSEDNGSLRVSIDFNVRTRRDRLKLEAGDDGEKLLGEDIYIMEIKSLEILPRWLIRHLSEHKIYPASYSKYGREYIKQLTIDNEQLTINNWFAGA